MAKPPWDIRFTQIPYYHSCISHTRYFVIYGEFITLEAEVCCRLHSDGRTPRTSANARENFEALTYPTASATREIGSRSSRNKSHAQRIRYARYHVPTGTPKVCRNAAFKTVGETSHARVSASTPIGFASLRVMTC